MSDKPVFIFTIALGSYGATFADCIRSQRAYCDRNGYEHLVVDQEPRRLRAEEAAWLKLPLLRRAMKPSRRWIGFIDADCEVRATTPPFDIALAKANPAASIYVAHGYSNRINSGVLFVRNCPEAAAFIDNIVAHADADMPPDDRAPYENGHVIAFGKNDPRVGIIDSHWNNNRGLDPASYIQHYSNGRLREGYMDRRFPARTRWPAATSVADRFARLWQRMHDRLMPAGPVSARLSKIVPFYEQAYGAFRAES